MSEFVRLQTDYKLPKLLEDAIDALEDGIKNHVSYIDCILFYDSQESKPLMRCSINEMLQAPLL